MPTLTTREFHRFEAAGESFVYVVPSAGVFQLDPAASAVLSTLEARPTSDQDLIGKLAPLFSAQDVEQTISDLRSVKAIGESGVPIEPAPKVLPPDNFPLTTMVLNVTNQCNLSCTYCYEYGEDKIVETENGQKPKFMSESTARRASILCSGKLAPTRS